MLFTEFNLSENLQKSIDDIGFTECTDVQVEALTHTLAGKDIFAQSQTGTGKTAAFLISLFELFERSEFRERALIIVPTRELATQIEAEARQLSVHLNYSIVSVYGGVGYQQQEDAIKNDVDVIIGTPGRLVDLCKKRTLNLKKFTCAVIDEADRMFDMGFVNDIRYLIRSMAPKSIRQTMLFSATLDYSIKRMALEFMTDPVEIAIEPETMTVDKIDQKLYHVATYDKMKLMLGLMKKHDAQHVIIFSNTKRACEEICARLNYNGFDAAFLTGDLPQNKRQKRVDRFKRRELKVLVATDVAARGIHVNDLDMVINYDIPQHAENYVHRIGRTARAGKSGTAITLACEMFVEFLSEIEKLIDMKIPSTVAIEEDYGEDASEKYRGKQILEKMKAKNSGGHRGKRGSNSKSRDKNSKGKKGHRHENRNTKKKNTGPVIASESDHVGAPSSRVRKKWTPSTEEEAKRTLLPFDETQASKSQEEQKEKSNNNSSKRRNNRKKRQPQQQQKQKQQSSNQTRKKRTNQNQKKKQQPKTLFGKIGSVFKKVMGKK